MNSTKRVNVQQLIFQVLFFLVRIGVDKKKKTM
jgi:hypothetical protein